jgi:hypothetical protein
LGRSFSLQEVKSSFSKSTEIFLRGTSKVGSPTNERGSTYLTNLASFPSFCILSATTPAKPFIMPSTTPF